MYFVYFIQSDKNSKIYVGRTSKLPDKRLEEHNIGSNKWTKVNGPYRLVYYEYFDCLTDAILREKYYKTGIGKQIKRVIVDFMNTIKHS